jgi:hypothetical protein
LTYLECVNKVLRRLRENEVTTVNETPYSKLIGDLLNVVKREVEDSWEWGVLRNTLTATTSNDIFNYTLTDSTTRVKVLDVINDTSDYVMEQRSGKWFDQNFLLSSSQKGAPLYYNFNGVSDVGDSQIDFFPIPDGVYAIRINCIVPQPELAADTDIIAVPYQIVVEGTIARAISERGDDGGYAEQEERYRALASDLIAIEAMQRPDELTWVPS